MKREYSEEMDRLVVVIPSKLKKWIRIISAKKGVSMSEYVEEVLTHEVMNHIEDWK